VNKKENILRIINYAIEESLPDVSVKEALSKMELKSNIYLLSIGKAAWRMAKAAYEILNDRVVKGIVITKYNHTEGEISSSIEIYEAGHPYPDENSLKATQKAMEMAKRLKEKDTLLFLISGGGSALFEYPLEGVTLEDIVNITKELMKKGANIYELNTVRKHLSAVKGGRFAKIVSPAKIVALVLSDVLGDKLDIIASGPAYPDSTTSEEALEVIERYNIRINPLVKKAISIETPKSVDNAKHSIIASVKTACFAAKEMAERLGYNTLLLSTRIQGEAREVAKVFAAILKDMKESDIPIKKPAAVIAGGETTVTVKGNGKGGRNQELALSLAIEIEGIEGITFASVGTDGTDGPTDAAGGIVDGSTAKILRNKGFDPKTLLENNDSYTALKVANALLMTGPTGTNVNDIIISIVQFGG